MRNGLPAVIDGSSASSSVATSDSPDGGAVSIWVWIWVWAADAPWSTRPMTAYGSTVDDWLCNWPPVGPGRSDAAIRIKTGLILIEGPTGYSRRTTSGCRRPWRREQDDRSTDAFEAIFRHDASRRTGLRPERHPEVRGKPPMTRRSTMQFRPPHRYFARILTVATALATGLAIGLAIGLATGLAGCNKEVDDRYVLWADTGADAIDLMSRARGTFGIQGTPTSTWLDPRSEADFAAGHIPGAINLPFPPARRRTRVCSEGNRRNCCLRHRPRRHVGDAGCKTTHSPWSQGHLRSQGRAQNVAARRQPNRNGSRNETRR